MGMEERVREAAGRVLETLPKAYRHERYVDGGGKVGGVEIVERGANVRVLGGMRLETCRSAGEVMAEAAKAAALVKVREMEEAVDSCDRQRAAETVLNYALGKPVERSVSIEMRVGNMGDREMEVEIERLLGKLGYAGREGAVAALLAGEGSGDGSDETEEVSTESGVAGEIREESGKDPVGSGGKPER